MYIFMVMLISAYFGHAHLQLSWKLGNYVSKFTTAKQYVPYKVVKLQSWKQALQGQGKFCKNVLVCNFEAEMG